MPLDTDFNVSPYFDDYNETKNFHRVLFKPAVSVQARELTQLQTILQNQIERFGNFVFKDGTVIQGVSQRSYGIKHVKIRDKVANGSTLLIEDMLTTNTYVRGLSTNVFAEIIQVADGAEVTAPDYKTLFVKYIQTGSNGTTKEFANNEQLVLVNQVTRANVASATGGVISANTLVSDATGNSLIFTVGDGLIYQKGHFIRVEAQEKIIGKYTLFPTTQVGFDVKEVQINSYLDDSLNDNALGSTNYQAPGADRLKLTPTLTQRDINEVGNSQPFFALAEFRNGTKVSQAQVGELDELGAKLAQRTYEESGDYILKPFNIRIQEHLNTNTNFGYYYSDGSNKGVVGNRNKLVALIEGGGVAYVRGYRNEIREGVPVAIDKGTDSVFRNAQAVTMNYGGYILVDQLAGKWSHKSTTGVTISLRSAAAKAVTSSTFGKTSAPGSEIGTAKFVSIAHETGGEEGGAGTAQFRIYVYDIEMNSGQSFNDVRSLYIANSMGSGEHSFADVILTSGAAKLNESNKNKLLFNFGTRAIKTLRDLSDTNDCQFQFRTETDFTISAGCTAPVISIAGGFDTGNQPEQITGSDDDFIITIISDAETKELSKATFSTGSNTVSRVSGNSFQKSYRAGDMIKLETAAGANAGIFKIHSVTDSDTITINGQPSATEGSGGETRKYYPAGYVIDLSRVSSANTARDISYTSSAITLTLNEDFASDTSASISYKVLKTSAEEKDKVVRRDRFVGIDLNTADGGTTGPWTLGITDVFNIKAIYKATTYGTGGTDVTDQFTLVSGQYDTHYENSSIKLKTDATVSLTGSDKLTVKLDYFSHDRTAGIGYFSVNSYPIDDTTSDTSANTINTAQIPTYKSPSTGLTYDLRDSVDFRPKYRNQTEGATVVGSIVTINTANTVPDHSSFGTYLPAVDTNFQADLQFYLPRKDKIVLNKEGRLYVAKGVPSLNPTLPRDQADAITLAELSIPPYPSLSPSAATTFNRPDFQTKLNLRTYKRYTMKDIGKIEDRIGRIEYYSALNLLEQSAKDIKELDSSGVDRFKNGFFAEPFIGHQLGDTSDISYKIAIDSKKGEARPVFTDSIVELDYDKNASSNVYDRPADATLSIDTASGSESFYNYIVTSLNAGNFVQVYQGSSYASATARGVVVAYGSTNRTLYIENVTGTSTALGKFAAGTIKTNTSTLYSGTITGVTYPESGELLTLPYLHVPFVVQPMASKVRNPVGELHFDWVGTLELFPSVDTWTDKTVLPDVQIELDLLSNWETLANAFGTQFGDWVNISTDVTTSTDTTDYGAYIETVETINTVNEYQREVQSLFTLPVTNEYTFGEYVTDISIIPYMRSRVVKFRARGMRPGTRVYAFFDDVKVSSYVAPTDSDFNETGAQGDPLLVDSEGFVYGRFYLPNNDTVKFTVGTKRFKLIDVTDLIVEGATATTSAATDYTASGLDISTTGFSIATREGILTPQTILENKVTSETDVKSSTEQKVTPQPEKPISLDPLPIDTSFLDTQYNFLFGSFFGPFEYQDWAALDFSAGLGCIFDPIAQSFKVPETAGNIFITKLDLYFKQKDDVYGLDIQIREMENGVITNRIVPFGRTYAKASDVNVSDNALIPTTFKFNTPVYLAGGKEYAFVVLPHGNAPRYRLWVSELGGTDITTQRLITSQPGVGVLFTSSNDSTYNAIQSEDIKFVLYHAYFDTTVTGTVKFRNTLQDHFRFANKVGNFVPGEQIRGATRIKVNNIGDSDLGAYTNTTLGSSISVNDQVRGLTSESVGLVRQIISQSANTLEILVDSANTFTNGETLRLTRTGSSNTSDVVFGLANTTGGQTNTSTAIVQSVNSLKRDMVANTSAGTFEANTNQFNGWVRGQLSNAVCQITSVKDFKIDIVTPKIAYIDYGNTNISFSHALTSNDAPTYTNGSLTSVTVGGINELDSEKLVASYSNANKRTYFLSASMSSKVVTLSPVVDFRKNPSVIAVQNIINNPYSNTGQYQIKELTDTGTAATRYISKPITLADGQDAEDIKLYITAYKPSGSEIKAYVKFKSAEDPETLDDKHYTMLTQITPSNVVSSSTNSKDFREYEFGLPSTNASVQTAYLFSGNNDVIRYHDDGGATYDTFKTFSVKLVMTGDNSAIVPRVTDLRAIALQK